MTYPLRFLPSASVLPPASVPIAARIAPAAFARYGASPVLAYTRATASVFVSCLLSWSEMFGDPSEPSAVLFSALHAAPDIGLLASSAADVQMPDVAGAGVPIGTGVAVRVAVATGPLVLVGVAPAPAAQLIVSVCASTTFTSRPVEQVTVKFAPGAIGVAVPCAVALNAMARKTKDAIRNDLMGTFFVPLQALFVQVQPPSVAVGTRPDGGGVGYYSGIGLLVYCNDIVIVLYCIHRKKYRKANKMTHFTMDGAALGIDGSEFETDADTLAVLNSIFPSAQASGDYSAVFALMYWGIRAGTIRKVD